MNISPLLVRWGYLAPRSSSAWPINRTESSTVWYHNSRPLGVMAPVLYCLAKALRMGTGSLYKMSIGSRATSLNNVSRLYQCPLTVAAIIVEKSLDISSATACNLSRKLVRWYGSTVSRAASEGSMCTFKLVGRCQIGRRSGGHGLRFHCLSRSQSCGGLCSSETAGTWPVGRLGGPGGEGSFLLPP